MLKNEDWFSGHITRKHGKADFRMCGCSMEPVIFTGESFHRKPSKENGLVAEIVLIICHFMRYWVFLGCATSKYGDSQWIWKNRSISLVVMTVKDWYLQWILPFFRSNQPTNWDDHKQRHRSSSHFIEISNHPSPPKHVTTPLPSLPGHYVVLVRPYGRRPQRRGLLPTVKWEAPWWQRWSTESHPKKIQNIKINMSPEKGPSQKEISSSNDDFSGSMLVFGGVHPFGADFLRVIGFLFFLQWYPTIRKPCLSRASEKSIAGFGVKEAIKMSSIPVPLGGRCWWFRNLTSSC